MSATTPFGQSILSLKTNALKNILFRASTITLQFAILRFCAYIAYLKDEYTSFLMFAEDIIQRSLFIVSRKMHRSAIIVLIFTIAFSSASMYDTLLWALDSPGYVVRSKVVNAAAFTPYLLREPLYVSTISDPDDDPERIKIDEDLASNLFIPGFNFSLLQSDYARTPVAIIPPPQMDPATGWGPRIYLDGDGFGLGFGPRYVSEENFCNATVNNDDPRYASWACDRSGEEGGAFLHQPVGRPLIWWSDHWPTALLPSDADNPWASLSIANDATAAMKQVITLTRGNKRHTFLQTTLMFSLYGAGEEIIAEGEIATLVQRSLALFYGDSSLAPVYVKACMDAQMNGTNVITRGFIFQNATYPAIALTDVGFINLLDNGAREGGFLHITHTDIELFRSETIPEPVQSAAQCDGETYNIATGGRIQSHPCYPVPAGSPSMGFVGQVDTAATMIITNILGDGTNDTSAVAFNQTGEQWYMTNRDRIDQLLLSRAFLVGGDAGLVRISIHHNEAAISYLQLLLIILPFVVALLTYAVMLHDRRGYYKKSLFASLAAACFSKAENRETAGYITNPPTLVVLASGIGTEDGPISIARGEHIEYKEQHVKDAGGGEEIIELLSAAPGTPGSYGFRRPS